MKLIDYNYLGKKDELVDDLACRDNELTFKELHILCDVVSEVITNNQNAPPERLKELDIIKEKLREIMNVIR